MKKSSSNIGSIAGILGILNGIVLLYQWLTAPSIIDGIGVFIIASAVSLIISIIGLVHAMSNSKKVATVMILAGILNILCGIISAFNDGILFAISFVVTILFFISGRMASKEQKLKLKKD